MSGQVRVREVQLGLCLTPTMTMAGGRLVLGHLADKCGRLRMFRISLFMLAATLVVWPHASSLASLIAVAICYGFFAGGYPSLPPTIIADHFDAPHTQHARFQLIGLSFSVETVGSLVGPSIAGFLFDEFGNYHTAAREPRRPTLLFSNLRPNTCAYVLHVSAVLSASHHHPSPATHSPRRRCLPYIAPVPHSDPNTCRA